jgi:hypothetical protein
MHNYQMRVVQRYGLIFISQHWSGRTLSKLLPGGWFCLNSVTRSLSIRMVLPGTSDDCRRERETQ